MDDFRLAASIDRRGFIGRVGGLAGAALLLAPSRASADDANRSAAWGRVLEPVPGGDHHSRDPWGTARADGEKRFSRAVDYARRTDSNSLLVWQDGQMLLARDFAPYGAGSRVWSASMAKTLVALAIGAAIADGVIASTDTAVADFLPAWRNDARRHVSIGHLLTMSGGIERGPSQFPDPAANFLGRALSVRAIARPGTRFSYNTNGVIVLMALLERATDRRFAAYLSAKLWQPLGCAAAQLAIDQPGGRALPVLFATSGDWLRIGILIAQRGLWAGSQLIPPTWIDRMIAPSAANPNYGFLIWRGSPPGRHRIYDPDIAFRVLHSEPFANEAIVYLDGHGGQRTYIVPAQRLVIVRTGAGHADWDDAILPNAVLRTLAAAEPD